MRGVLTLPAASEQAGVVDSIVLGLLVISILIVLLVTALIVGFSVRYRRGSPAPRGPLPSFARRDLEMSYVAGTALMALFLFIWAAVTLVSLGHPVRNAAEIHVEAKQWMWKTRHPNGAREINELHVPAGEDIRLVMTSQDVIHSFFVPAFRVKMDVLPGRFTEIRLRAIQTGDFALRCAEYCGTLHARMTGRVVVMDPGPFARWLAAQPQADDIAKEGAALFVGFGCAGCHTPGSSVHAPDLRGIYGRPVHLSDARVVQADEAYIRDSILQPRHDIVAGYAPIMPSFSGLVSDADLERLVAYVRSLREGSGP
ncbi:MAG: cytochrome c oxidase subunit II [Acetobacteraceae bacterium]|nr:cytochrome c oxidase subunit II [Acetobacteraceae bacterium]